MMAFRLPAAAVVSAVVCLTQVLLYGSASAASTAIINASLYTGEPLGEEQSGVIEGASIRFENGLITEVSHQALTADRVIDAKGRVVTPGFIGSLNQLGLIEVSAVAQSNDGQLEEPDLNFTPILAFNPESSAVPLARTGGLTHSIVTPGQGKGVFAGVAGAAGLTSQLVTPDATPRAAVLYLLGDKNGSRAWQLEKLRQALKARQDQVTKAATEPDADTAPQTQKEQRLDRLLSGQLPLLAVCNRPIDILQLVALKSTFGLALIIAGGDGAVAVREQLAEAKVPVLLDPLNSLPVTFDSLHASLSNAALLHEAGVQLGLTVLSDASHLVYQLRFGAGNAIANGLPRDAALAAITSVPARLFGLNRGLIAKGKAADLVLWHGDPFDYSGRVHSLWIDGKAQSLTTRADQLRNRYRNSSEMPAAYTK